LETLYQREDRLYAAKWAPGTSSARRRCIELAQHRVWELKTEWSKRATREAQDELWPNGLPAHP
jgi:hypothetical protein